MTSNHQAAPAEVTQDDVVVITTPLKKRRIVEPSAVVTKTKKKTIFDRLYGSIEMEPLLIAFMDTEEFQRLDKIQQLGGSSYVFPSAKHTRKEHSIGVAYLAGEMVRRLRKDVEITRDEQRCVELAGLCHDMGHGPYSHMFETIFSDVDHEKMSQCLVRRCAQKIEGFADFFDDPDTSKHVDLVCALIEGEEIKGVPSFLFDIVSNSRSGVDVDKIDYLQRDAVSTLGMAAPFDVKRLINSCRAYGGRIRFEEKVAMDINTIFSVRADLHRQVYQHRVGNVAEMMITDVLLEADKSEFRIRGKRLSEAAVDPELFVLLTDGLLDAIKLSDASGLGRAKKILDRLSSRDFYKAVGPGRALPTLPVCARCSSETAIEAKFCGECGHTTETRAYELDPSLKRVPIAVARSTKSWKEEIIRHCDIDPSKFIVKISKIRKGWGCDLRDPHEPEQVWKSYSPLANVKFWNPRLPPEEWRDECNVSRLFLPERNLELVLYCYYKNDGTPRAEEEFDRLCRACDSIFTTYAEDQGRSNIFSPSPQKKKRALLSAAAASRAIVDSPILTSL